MCTKKEETFGNYFSTAFHSASKNSTFLKIFTEQSKSGNEHKIIEIIEEIPEIKNLIIKESYISKNNDQAEKFMKEANRAENDQDKLLYLTKAVFAAKFSNDYKKVFFDALMRRISLSFASENLNKCLKYSRYMVSALKEGVSADLKETEHRIYKIECLSYETRCLKDLGYSENARILARDGIREAKMLFQIMEEEGIVVSNKEKLERLEPFLRILNENKNDIEGKLSKQVMEDEKLISDVKSARKIEIIPVTEVFGKRNSKLKSCSDAVTLKYDKERGRHLIATRNIKIGSVLIIDEPFAWSTEAQMLQRNCLHCHESLVFLEMIKIPCRNCQRVNYCSENCRRESWNNYHRWECSIFDYFDNTSKNQTQSSRLLLAYRTSVRLATENMDMDRDEKEIKLNEKLAKYYSKNKNCEDEKSLEIGLGKDYDPLDYRTIYSLETNSKDIDPLVNLSHAIHSVILAKCFRFVSNNGNVIIKKRKENIKIKDADEHALAVATLRHFQAINSNAYEIVENVLDKRSKVWEPRSIGGAIYATVSLTNHSCYPNIIRHTYPKGKVVVRAIRFIKKGEEIFDCYGPHYLRDEKIERQNYLLKKYNFNCTCEACNNNLESSKLSVVSSQPQLQKCKTCRFEISEKLSKNSCPNCGARIDKIKTDKTIEESIKQRSFAIQKMLDGDHAAALPILLRHAELVDKIFPVYNFEAVKTQQALIQCYNSMGCISE